MRAAVALALTKPGPRQATPQLTAGVRQTEMITERRRIQQEEVEVILVTMRQAPVRSIDDNVVTSVATLTVISRCECGCASVDFNKRSSAHRSKPLGDGVGATPRGGRVGVIVWGRHDAITALEIYDLGAGEGDLRLPVPESIMPWENSGAG